MTLKGTSFIGSTRGEAGDDQMFAVNPATGEPLEPAYHTPRLREVDGAVNLATEASFPYGRLPGSDRAKFLRTIADNIESLGDALVDRATAETGLPAGRIQGERARTCGQLRMFADLAEEGSWVDARIDHAIPDRVPLPKPDVRSMLRPLGPVTVFCASNFPLAFSVAGGDTASALAAGNPVLVKAHHAHPGTAELVGGAVQKAVADCGLHEGVFSLLYGSGREIGTALVGHPGVKAVGFTGSRAGGRALMETSHRRPDPIPVYAEMSSINPVVILPGALAERAAQIATGLHGSLTLGVGQFCTNPGLVVLDAALDASAFTGELQRLVAATEEATMLTSGIHQAYCSGVKTLQESEAVKQIATAEGAGAPNAATPAVFETSATSFLYEDALNDEVFGPAALVVKYGDNDELLRLARSLEGQLTITLHATDKDLADFAELVQILETRTGRLVLNGFPTGVEVCQSIVHGGPFPATSDGRSTSVGTAAIFRFVRPVCYQDFSEAHLPDALKDANPLGLSRIVDGVRT